MVEAVVAHFGRLDLLVNNAGIQVWEPLLELEEAGLGRGRQHEPEGLLPLHAGRGAQMRTQGGGGIINIGSGCNKVPFPELVSYTASKGGIEMLTKVAAVELGPLGIRVNCIAPGAIEVERTRLEREDYAGTWAASRRCGGSARRPTSGRAVVMIDDERAAFITGQTILVDGGLFTCPPWPPDSSKEVAT